LAVVLLVGCGPTATSTDETSTGANATQSGAAGPDDQPGPPRELSDAERILAKTVELYRGANSYADAGKVRFLVQPDPAGLTWESPFSLTLKRPNKVRIGLHEMTILSDGEQFYALTPRAPKQILRKPAPAALTMSDIYNDQVLPLDARQHPDVMPQLLLLLEEDPLESILYEAEAPVLVEPETIDGRLCHRIRAKHPGGTIELWIDQESHVLRRMVHPDDEMKAALERSTGTQLEAMSLVAEFTGARLDGEIAAEAFQCVVPDGVDVVDALRLYDVTRLLGQRVPDFKFVDLEGNPVTRESLLGKIAVLDFWATWCTPCREGLPKLAKVYEQYKDNPNFVFLAISVDGAETKDQALLDLFAELKVDLPILRDTDQSAAHGLEVLDYPTTLILDAGGVVQSVDVGLVPNAGAVFADRLQRLAAGEDLARTTGIEFAQGEVAPRSDPKTLKLTPAWKCPAVKTPGYILPDEGSDAAPRLLVIDAFKTIAEVGLDGKLIANHRLAIEESELINGLRTAATAGGKRYFAAFGMDFQKSQRFHLLDGDLQLLGSYPENAIEHPHPGIYDVQLADLEGNGQLAAYVGYWDVVGLQRIALDGRRLWSNRSLVNVARIGVGGPDSQGRRMLFCTNSNGTLAAVNSTGKALAQVMLGGRQLLLHIAAADLDGDGQPEWCGHQIRQTGDCSAIGFNLNGETLWRYVLPPGTFPMPVERIVPGKLTPGAAGQWLLPGPDGSIHVIAADGKPLDKFNYGAALSGLATVQSQGKTLLVVASPGGLEAFEVR